MMKSFTVKALAKPTGELTLACMASSDLKSPPTGAALCGYKFNKEGQFKAKYDMSKLDCAITYKALPKVHPRARVCPGARLRVRWRRTSQRTTFTCHKLPRLPLLAALVSRWPLASRA